MRSLLCTALLALASAMPAHAGSLLDLSVIDRDNGQTLPTYSAGGKLYVAGTPGHRYAVRLVNRTGARVLAVLSVDGVNAVSGESADTSQTGYVLDPWESAEINGWRKNLDEIAQFNFTTLPDSYASRTGRPANVGVIGVAVFQERRIMPPKQVPDVASRQEAPASDERGMAAARPAPPPAGAAAEGETRDSSAGLEQAQSAAAASMARAPAPLPTEKLGTGHGAREYSHVNQTTFERATRRPAEVLAIWYDSHANLVARGIIPRPSRPPREPQPFPNSFVPDPPRH